MASYKIKPGNIFGRIGEGFGQGLGQQIPKEIDRQRLQSGLEDVANNSGDLSPFQKFARLSGVPGITPQQIESGTRLLEREAKGNALASAQDKGMQGSPFPQNKANMPASPEMGNAPSITKSNHLAEIQKGYLPPTQDEIYAEAGRRYNENPALFANDPQKAIQIAEESAIRDEKRFLAHEKQNERLNAIQDNIISRLKDQSSRLGAQIPADTYSKIEDEAVLATKPIEDGGRGLTEQQAMKEYGTKLDKVSREYADLKSLGGLGMLGRSSKSTFNSYKKASDEFAKRGDSRNLAEYLIETNSISYPLAYAIAEPVGRDSQLGKELRSIPTVPIAGTPGGGKEEKRLATLKIAPKISKMIGNASPLSVVYELEKKGYDGKEFINYLNDKKDNLTGRQIEQLGKTLNEFGSLNDWWLQNWSGIGE